MPTILTQAESETLARCVLGKVSVPHAQVGIESGAVTSMRFARGDAHVASENETVSVGLSVVTASGFASSVGTNRVDDEGLAALVAEAERTAEASRSSADGAFLGPQTYSPGPPIFFNSTVAATAAETQTGLRRAAIEAAESVSLVSAGDIAVELSSRALLNTSGLVAYSRETYGEFSMTARTKDGRGSGWAWSGYGDWERVKHEDIVMRAVDLARRSANPIAVEPGRYAVILEPAAVAALVEPITWFWNAWGADHGQTVFAKDPPGTNKIGLQMLDSRLRMVSSPWDAERPSSTVRGDGRPIREPVSWFERGVLTNLAYDPGYAVQQHRAPVFDPGGVRLESTGSTATLEEMIAATPRGVWVNRFSSVTMMKMRTLFLTGTTRDGTFLIENGKITKAIRNFRFTESPFFVLNKLEAAGTPERASRLIVAPRLKVRDFDFTSLTDAI